MGALIAKNGMVFFNKDFHSEQDVDNQRENAVDYRKDFEKELMMLVAATPKDVCPTDEQDPLFWVRDRAQNLIDSICEETTDIAECDQAYSIIDSWKYASEGEVKLDLSQAENQKYVFPGSYDEYTRKTFNKEHPFEPCDYTSIDEINKACEEDFNHDNACVLAKYMATYKGQPVVNESNQLLYTTEEAALKAAKEALRYPESIFNLMSKKYLEAHPEFAKDLKSHMTADEIVMLDKFAEEGLKDYNTSIKIADTVSNIINAKLYENIKIIDITKL